MLDGPKIPLERISWVSLCCKYIYIYSVQLLTRVTCKSPLRTLFKTCIYSHKIGLRILMKSKDAKILLHRSYCIKEISRQSYFQCLLMWLVFCMHLKTVIYCNKCQTCWRDMNYGTTGSSFCNIWVSVCNWHLERALSKSGLVRLPVWVWDADENPFQCLITGITKLLSYRFVMRTLVRVLNFETCFMPVGL